MYKWKFISFNSISNIISNSCNNINLRLQQMSPFTLLAACQLKVESWKDTEKKKPCRQKLVNTNFLFNFESMVAVWRQSELHDISGQMECKHVFFSKLQSTDSNNESDVIDSTRWFAQMKANKQLYALSQHSSNGIITTAFFLPLSHFSLTVDISNYIIKCLFSFSMSIVISLSHYRVACAFRQMFKFATSNALSGYKLIGIPIKVILNISTIIWIFYFIFSSFCNQQKLPFDAEPNWRLSDYISIWKYAWNPLNKHSEHAIKW